MIEGTCHCGAVRWTFEGEPTHATSCNCSLCRLTVPYVQGDRALAMHHCPVCGVTTHWSSLIQEGEEGHDRTAVNMRLADPAVLAHLRIRHFDGADTWTFLD